jgi:hypothetical protein
LSLEGLIGKAVPARFKCLGVVQNGPVKFGRTPFKSNIGSVPSHFVI